MLDILVAWISGCLARGAEMHIGEWEKGCDEVFAHGPSPSLLMTRFMLEVI